MVSGLPTFATCHGGPAEIIEDGVSGFHIDPYHPDNVASLLVNFFQRCKEDPTYWEEISKAGLQRILDRFVFLYGIESSSLKMRKVSCTVSKKQKQKMGFHCIAGTHGRFTLKG